VLVAEFLTEGIFVLAVSVWVDKAVMLADLDWTISGPLSQRYFSGIRLRSSPGHDPTPPVSHLASACATAAA
jgi:hypothetical protein